MKKKIRIMVVDDHFVVRMGRAAVCRHARFAGKREDRLGALISATTRLARVHVLLTE